MHAALGGQLERLVSTHSNVYCAQRNLPECFLNARFGAPLLKPPGADVRDWLNDGDERRDPEGNLFVLHGESPNASGS